MLSIEVLISGAMMVSLTFYALLGGADFGGGVWDLFASGSRKRAQRIDSRSHRAGLGGEPSG